MTEAYQHVRSLVSKSKSERRNFSEIIFEDQKIKTYLDRLDESQKIILREPERYVGISVRKTEDVCNFWENEMREIRCELQKL
jgi:hypothetical protein